MPNRSRRAARNTQTATEYRNLPLNVFSESTTNPRRIFEDAALKELAESIRTHGVLSPLLVRPITEESFEIVAGARRYRAAQIAEAVTVPVRIVSLTDAEAMEVCAQLKGKRRRSTDQRDLPSNMLFFSCPSSHPKGRSRKFESVMFCPPDGQRPILTSSDDMGDSKT